ncbi:hypothetical protein I317_05413 [Kwoniella heveanensis CBS 569]|uniref:Short-chain dehydrogenase n=1 Tax=Kwoniella heveanensis BCC8398 TaxID=1296120 RepID=A0A1B9GMC4_9TREE|nr:hypothetical protein I316_06144 [Kwoniella heveanensis BCC8398]OCF40801.1 hypothetical protein I317_05413 [Kwoniella heveanensis CBS 569]
MSAPSTDNTIVLVTGGNTGIGYAITEALLGGDGVKSSAKYTVIITSRTLAKSTQAAGALRSDSSVAEAFKSGFEVVPAQLDIDNDVEIERIVKSVGDQYGRLDVLVNNAGVQHDSSVLRGEMTIREAFAQTFDTNVSSTHLLTSALIPLLLKSSSPRIVFVSSGIGSLAEHSWDGIPINQSPPAGWPKKPTFNITTYRTTKTAMNMMILEWIRVLKNDNVKIHIIDPGLLATNLGGSTPDQLRQMGAREPIEGGRFIKSVIEGKRDGDMGKMIRDGAVVPW